MNQSKTPSTTNIEFISAGAGSGKTYTLTERMEVLLASGEVNPAGILATTFTKMAAAELHERVRQKLIESGKTQTANAMGQSLIGTVNGVCGSLIERFSFEAGLPPEQTVLDEADATQLFNQSLDETLESDTAIVSSMNKLATKLGIVDERTKAPLWRGQIQNIVDAARSNNLDREALMASIETSAESLFNYFPKVSRRDLSDELASAMARAINQFDPDEDKTKGSKTYFNNLKSYQRSLNNGTLAWPDWIRLSKAVPTKKSLALAEAVQSIASDYGKHPSLRADISEFIGCLFTVAADALTVYRNLKARRSLMDFVDQEQRLLEILDQPLVAEALSEELQLLMVDEFQDTSPIQLAIFIKLSALADKAIWVGDIKQSIYGFRGSDPSLMLTVIDHLKQQGAPINILPKSWRSRPELVEYINNLFVPAFANSLSEDQVALVPATQSPLKCAAVEHWQLQGKNKEQQADALAGAIQKMVASDKQAIVDRHTKQERALQYGDIAVLCRSNNNLAEQAEAFAEFGIPVSYLRAGLLNTPEATFAMACLRRLASERDTLATAEIRALSLDESAEDWLSDRLQYLQQDLPSSRWSEDSIAALQALSSERVRLLHLTPSEAFEQALQVTGAREVVARWCKTPQQVEQRLKNIEALLGYSQQYLDSCLAQNLAATVPGLILWLQQLQASETDFQATPDSGAVVLLTHHRSKGLEWPMVVAADLSARVRPRIWGLQVEPSADGFDMANPLAGRRLRYWPGFFGAQTKGIAIKDDVEQGVEGQQALLAASEEDKRLLYVSLTRARDKLVLLSTEKKPNASEFGHWWDCVEVSSLLPEADSLSLDGGTEIDTTFVSQPVAESQFTQQQQAIHWLGAGAKVSANQEPFTARYLSPSSASPIATADIGESLAIAERIDLHGNPDMSALGDAIHAVIATAVINGSQCNERTARVLADHGVAEAIDADKVEAMAANFISAITEKFQPLQWLVEKPISFVNAKGQEVHGFIDLLLETKQGWVVIDHKSSPKARSEWHNTALEYSGQLETYRQALEAVTEKPVVGSWIHYAVTGGLVEVKLPLSEVLEPQKLKPLEEPA